MRKILFLPISGIIGGFLILFLMYYFSYESQLVLFLDFVLIAGSVMLFRWLARKTYADIEQIGPFTRITQPTNLDCPRCSNKLNSYPGQFPPLYACSKCGYHGAIALNPKIKTKRQRKFR